MVVVSTARRGGKERESESDNGKIELKDAVEDGDAVKVETDDEGDREERCCR